MLYPRRWLISDYAWLIFVTANDKRIDSHFDDFLGLYLYNVNAYVAEKLEQRVDLVKMINFLIEILQIPQNQKLVGAA